MAKLRSAGYRACDACNTPKGKGVTSSCYRCNRTGYLVSSSLYDEVEWQVRELREDLVFMQAQCDGQFAALDEIREFVGAAMPEPDGVIKSVDASGAAVNVNTYQGSRFVEKVIDAVVVRDLRHGEVQKILRDLLRELIGDRDVDGKRFGVSPKFLAAVVRGRDRSQRVVAGEFDAELALAESARIDEEGK